MTVDGGRFFTKQQRIYYVAVFLLKHVTSLFISTHSYDPIKNKKNIPNLVLTNQNSCFYVFTTRFQKKKYCRTRNSNNLEIPLFKSKSGQRTFEYRGVKIWNNLNNELKSEISLTTFKHNVKKALIAEK